VQLAWHRISVFSVARPAPPAHLVIRVYHHLLNDLLKIRSCQFLMAAV
jgi:hypothetical protein